MEKIRVLIADDHTMFREGLRSMLEIQDEIDVVGEAPDGNVAVQKSDELQFDVILLDLEMPELDGIAAARIIRRRRPDIGIIVLTMYEDDKHLFEAVRAGVNAYVSKESSVEKLLSQIKVVSKGESILDSSITRRVLNEFGKLAGKRNPYGTELPKKLTPREREVLNLLADKIGNKQIARRLFVSEKTVKNHISSIYRKLGCGSRTEAVLQGIRLGLLEVDVGCGT